MESLRMQEPLSAYTRRMEHHQPAYHGIQAISDDYAHRSRSSGRTGSPLSHAIDPYLSSTGSESTRWAARHDTTAYHLQGSPSEQSVPSGNRPVPRSMASLLQGEMPEPALSLHRKSGEEWNHPSQQVPARSTATPTQDVAPKDDRPTLPSFNAVCQKPRPTRIGQSCIF